MVLASSLMVDQVVVTSSTIRMVSDSHIFCASIWKAFSRFESLWLLFRPACVCVERVFLAVYIHGSQIFSESLWARTLDWL